MLTLGEALDSRSRNNFDVLRLAAALMVLFTHSYALSGSPAGPLVTRFIYEPYPFVGNYPVAIFFAISGLLVTKSFNERRSWRQYAVARVLRIYPTLVLGVAVSGLLALACSADRALAGAHFWTYFWNNATGFQFIGAMPGAYPSNPFPTAANGSLWSLPVELRMYVLVALIGCLASFDRRRLCTALLGMLAAAVYFVEPAIPWLWAPDQSMFPLEFALGMLAYMWRDRLKLSLTLAAALAAVVIAVGIAGGPRPCQLLFFICLPYWVFVIACHPRMPKFRLPGDYSYAIYVYSFPIQQAVEHWRPELGFAQFLLITSAAICAVSVVSWHFYEKPLLQLKPARSD